jgi:hypothetical protein
MAWGTSLAVHVGLLGLLAFLTLVLPHPERALQLSLDRVDLEEPEPLPEEFFASEEVPAEMGALSQGGLSSALAAAPRLRDESVVVFQTNSLADLGEAPVPKMDTEVFDSPELSQKLPVQGVGSVGTTGATGAIDRITREIVLSLEQGPTLVVWLFDQSGSLRDERAAILKRLGRVYEELGVIEAADNPAFRKHEDKPLLTSVLGFGAVTRSYTDQPTDRIDQIESAIDAIEDDETGVENVFGAVADAARKYRTYRTPSQGRRHVMLVVFTDESGDDLAALDPTVAICRKLAMPVYVVGRPAPFGRENAYVKWIDPDPRYDQRPQWVPVHLGPESLVPERLKLHFTGRGTSDPLLDSGFGPYALTRLCYETGGLYFASHPNRQVGRSISGFETANLSAHFTRFFDAETMRRYQPNYVSPRDYQRLLAENRARAALVEAAQMSWTSPLENVRTEFPKRDEASLAQALTTAQQAAALIQPKIDAICRVLERGAVDREQLREPRWQAGYDLALGRALAVQIRTAGYNAMLAQAKQGMPFENEKNNTWRLREGEEFVSSSLEKVAEKAAQTLQRVQDDHPGTPWAYLAEQEAARPLGWRWVEAYTALADPEAGNNRPRRRPEEPMPARPQRRNPPPL